MIFLILESFSFVSYSEALPPATPNFWIPLQMANMLFPGLGVMKLYFGEGGGVAGRYLYIIRRKKLHFHYVNNTAMV